MLLPVEGHPLHTRSLTLVVSLREDGRWNARGDVIDLRKVGFVPMMGDIQPAGIIHQMSIDLVVDPGSERIDSVEVDQPFVAIEPSAEWGGECCRDPAPRLLELAGERLDGAFARRLSGVFGGVRGCSHLLTLFQLMASGLEEAFVLEAALDGAKTARPAGDRLFRRAVFVEGFEATNEDILMTVQLADFHTRPAAGNVMLDRLAGQWDVRAFARTSGPSRILSDMLLADRHRTGADIGDATWKDRSDRLAPLEGAPIVGGLARKLFEGFSEPQDRRLLDATLQLAPGYIQVMAAVMDRVFARARDGAPEAQGNPMVASGGPIGGMADSCYMWRSEGRMLQLRNERLDLEE